MTKIACFEDIQAWQKARTLATLIYAMTNEGLLARDFGLRDQMRRAVVSILSNIAEGFERGAIPNFCISCQSPKGLPVNCGRNCMSPTIPACLPMRDLLRLAN